MYSTLYIDDDASFLSIGKRFLEKSGEIQVDTLVSARKAPDILKENSYDLIIADYEMPGMNGIELLKKLREEGNTIPFIIFTGKGREDVAIEALNSGASFYLQKGGEPHVQFTELINMINRAVTQKKAELELARKAEDLSRINEELTAKEGELRHIVEHMTRQESIIRENEERFRLVLEATSDGIWDWDLRSNKAYFSDRYFQMLGYEPGEFESSVESWRSIIHPDDLKHAQSVIRESIRTKNAVFDIESRFRTKDGSYRWIHIRGKAVAWNDDGSPRRIVGSHIDISYRKQMEDSLLVSEEKYRLLAENSRDLIFRIRVPEGTFEYISQSVRGICGYTPDEFYQSPVLLQSVIAPSSHEYFDKAWKELQQGIIPEEFEFQVLSKTGELKWVNERNVPIYNESGRLVAVQGIVTDITNRRIAEEQNLENIKKYEILFETIPTGIIITDDTGHIRELNRNAAEILGISQEDLRDDTNHLEWTMFGQDGEVIFKGTTFSLGKRIEGEEILGREYGVVSPYGHIIWVIANTSPLRVQGYGSVLSFQDISERKRTEQALFTVNKKLSLLTSITRHDIKNSLSALRGYLYLLDEEIRDREQQEFIARLKNIAGDINRKIEFTSTYQKIGATNPEWQDLSGILGGLSADGITIENLAEDVRIFADQMLSLVFENLVLNSRMHGEKVTRIWFSTRHEDQNLVLVCEDDGVGIREEEKEAIFERGFGKNTGFGLFLIREILSITNLSIRENGVPGAGARFEITIYQGTFQPKK
ncbi:MAG: PAS domain S-box protein [Methanospirillum sp.]|nr:PAS domain S-box protein [Methanospirillum sp.]